LRWRSVAKSLMSDVESLQRLFAPLLPGLLGMTLTEVSANRIAATLLVRRDLCTTGDVLHGGTIMAFADTLGAVGTILNLPSGARTATVESSTKFVGPARLGDTVTGECTSFHRGRTTMVWQTLVKSGAGKLCAIVTQTQLVIAG
jgi:1,4-dihydroxy-2-naphthoyl-CoA hydrolase